MMSQSDEELCCSIKEMILSRVQNTFNMQSKTHIFYHLGPCPDIKGFGDWPNQAYENFEHHLTLELEAMGHTKLVELEQALKALKD